jgi:hypothetical protein
LKKSKLKVYCEVLVGTVQGLSRNYLTCKRFKRKGYRSRKKRDEVKWGGAGCLHFEGNGEMEGRIRKKALLLAHSDAHALVSFVRRKRGAKGQTEGIGGK